MMDTLAVLIGLPCVLGTVVRAGHVRGVSGERLRARRWRWLLLAGLGVSAAIALLADDWFVTAVLIAGAGFATIDPTNDRSP